MSPPILDLTNPTHTQTTCSAHNITPTELNELHQRSVAAKATAYCPYSQFRVGAVVLASDGTYIPGANVENASYPVGTCAERVALGRAVTDGFRSFKALAVATDIAPPASPCGMCRQFIREFCDLEVPILLFDKDGKYVVVTLRQLLPLSFGPEALPSPQTLAAARGEKSLQ